MPPVLAGCSAGVLVVLCCGVVTVLFLPYCSYCTVLCYSCYTYCAIRIAVCTVEYPYPRVNPASSCSRPRPTLQHLTLTAPYSNHVLPHIPAYTCTNNLFPPLHSHHTTPPLHTTTPQHSTAHRAVRGAHPAHRRPRRPHTPTRHHSHSTTDDDDPHSTVWTGGCVGD